MSSQEALDLVARYDRLLNRYEREAIAAVDEALLRAFQQLENQLRATYPTLRDTPIVRRQAMIARQLGSLLDVTQGGDYQAEFNNLIREASLQGSESAVEITSLFDDELGQQMTAFADVPLEAIAAQAQGATERMRRHGADFARKSSALIETNLALGRAVSTTTRQLRQQLGVTRGQAETIVRTETIGAFDSAAQQRYDEAGLFSQVFSVGDRRVCQFCAYRNGRVYKTADIKLPFHPDDRCYRVCWSREWAKLGLIDEEFVNQYAADGIAALKSEGKQPDSGLAPFERVNGRRTPPKPVWSPTTEGRIQRSQSSSEPVNGQETPPVTPHPSYPDVEYEAGLNRKLRDYEQIGRGGNGVVYLDEATNTVVKVGIVGDPSRGLDDIASNIEANRLGVGPRILSVGRVNARGRGSYRMEHIEGQTLERELPLMGREQKLAVARNILDQVIRLHEGDLVHGDLGAPNVMVNGSDVTIIDFGNGRKGIENISQAPYDSVAIFSAIEGEPEQAQYDEEWFGLVDRINSNSDAAPEEIKQDVLDTWSRISKILGG